MDQGLGSAASCTSEDGLGFSLYAGYSRTLCSGLAGFFLVLKMEPQIPMDPVSIVTPSPNIGP